MTISVLLKKTIVKGTCSITYLQLRWDQMSTIPSGSTMIKILSTITII